MSSKNKAVRDLHAKMYIDAVFAETLKQEGFINPDGKSISWYRVVNNELIHAVYFHATWGSLPLMGMKIESRVFPMYNKPDYYSGIYSGSSNRHFGYRVMKISDLPDEHGNICMAPYSRDIQVMACTSGKRGLSTLETKVLPWFQQTMTLADYYRLAEGEYKNSVIFSDFLLADISTLCILYDETDKYLFYSNQLATDIPQWVDEKKKANLIVIKAVLDGGNRDEFLQNLEVQKAKNIKWMKKMGIIIG